MQDIHEQSYHTSEIDQKPMRTLEYLKYRELVYVQLLKAGMDKEADRYLLCSDPGLIFVVDGSGDLPDGVMGVNACSESSKHPAKAICPTCHLRYCCDCAHRQSARLLARYVPFMKGLVRDYSDDVYKLRHIMLSTPIALTDPDCREKMHELFNVIRDQFWDELIGKGWRERCGVLIASDFGENGLKLHFHILAYCPYLDKELITEAWKKVTGGLCEVNWIRLVTESEDQHTVDGAVAEILKYATKLWKKDKNGKIIYLDPTLVPVLARVLKGTRRIRSYGLFNSFEVEERQAVCEVCAAALVRLDRFDWNVYCNTGFLPHAFATARLGIGLDLRIGNNFFEGGGGKKPDIVQLQLVLPAFTAELDAKYQKQFELGG